MRAKWVSAALAAMAGRVGQAKGYSTCKSADNSPRIRRQSGVSLAVSSALLGERRRSPRGANRAGRPVCCKPVWAA